MSEHWSDGSAHEDGSEPATSALWGQAEHMGGQPRRDAEPAGRTSRGARIVGLGAALTAVVLAAGSIGYLIGNRGGPATASPFPRGSVTFPGDPFGNVSPSGGSGFGIPQFGSGFPGASTSVTVPSSVKASERALVDIDTTIDGGQAAGAGTGIVLTSNGEVLTNNHVIDGASSISVTDLGNGHTYGATVVGYDVTGDVAVLKLTGASGLTVATIGQPATVGTTVYAVGNAGGTGGTPTVTSGKVTALGQPLTASDSFNGTSETLSGMLETDATLISGDSGGALTTANGSVVGMDTAASSTNPTASTGSQGYAIPIQTALGLAREISNGDASVTIHIGPTALLGVEISGTQSSTDGAVVSSVASGTPAARAGITAGSRVTSVGGLTVSTSASLRLVMARLSPATPATVTWVDTSGKTHSAKVTLAAGAPQ